MDDFVLLLLDSEKAVIFLYLRVNSILSLVENKLHILRF